MFEFFYIKKIKVILTFFNFSKYAAWCGFFIFQGRAIQQAIDKNILLEQLIQTLILFVLTKLLVMISDILSQFFIGYFENKEMNKQWIERFPRKIFQDNEGKNNLIYLMYFDHLPRLFNIECNIISNKCTIFNVLIIVTTLLIYTGFYFGLIALLAVFILSFTSKNIFLKKLDFFHKEINENKANTLGWINQFFRSYKEVSFNWNEQVNDWIQSMYSPIYQSKNKFVIIQLMRDILSQFLIEFPFIINTAILVVAVYLNYLSITQLFVWIGFSQFVINSSNSFLENKINNKTKIALVYELEEILSSFQIDKNQNSQLCLNSKHIKNVVIKLQDSTVNHLSLIPSVYHIKGTNGSGKSTLLNTIIGYERQVRINNHENLLYLFKNISIQKIRVIDREPEIFNLLKTFNQQILGPEQAKLFSWKQLLHDKMSSILTGELIKELSKAFFLIEDQYYKRRNARFSSGEKILISLMRALTSWNKEVSILVVDECTVFLDQNIKTLFLRCIYELSNSIAVYLSAHESINMDALGKKI